MTRRIAIVTIVLSCLSGAVSTAVAGPAANFCDWTSTWAPAGSMNARRDGATATVLQNGRILMLGGWDGTNTINVGEIYDPATDSYTTTSAMLTSRTNHVAVLLNDGRVLIAGGIQVVNGVFAGRLASAEIYDPSMNAFLPVGSMGTDRQDAAAVLLTNGRVLVSGGFGRVQPNISQWLTTAEIFDPATGSFSPTAGAMLGGRGAHRLTRLHSGAVLVTGGYNGFTPVATAEIFNPGTSTFASTGAMQQARGWHTATLLSNGTVMVTGGTGASAVLASVETFNPSTGTFSSSGTMNTARTAHSAALLPNGRLLITGGDNGAGAVSAAEWSSRTGLGFDVLPAMPEARAGHVSIALSGGNVLIAGGRNATGRLNSAVIFDPLFASVGSMGAVRNNHTATRLASGQVLIAGGQSNGVGVLPVATAEMYNPGARSFAPVGSMATPRYFHSATLLNDGRVLVVGGATGFTGPATATAEIFNPSTQTFSAAGSMATARYNHTATLLANGLVLIAGGWSAGTRLSSAELYNPATNTFTATGAMNQDRVNHTATLLQNGRVLITGGWSTGAGGIAFSTELYDPSNGTFTMPPQMHWLWTNRAFHVATPLPNGTVLITGGTTSGITPTRKAEIYDPNTNTFHWTGDMISTRSQHAVAPTSLPGGDLMVLGGVNGGATVELYDPSTETFRAAPGSMQFDRANHTATLLADATVLVTGGTGNGRASAEVSKPTRCGPAITSLSPDSGAEGSIVTIRGSQFGVPQGMSTVTFNGIAATVTSWNDTTIVATVPGGATTGPVVVTVNGRASNGVTFTVGLADLIVSSIVTTPTYPQPGQNVSVAVTVVNVGPVTSEGFYIDFYMNRTTPPGFAYGDAFCFRSGLAAGASNTCTVTVSYAANGTYNMWAQVDTDRTVMESNEGNNVLGPQSIIVAPPTPDLMQRNVSDPPSQAGVRTLFAVTDDVRNMGSASAAATTTQYYLSSDRRRDASDTLLVGTRAIPALAVGLSDRGTASVEIPRTTVPGTYFLLACADDLQVLNELFETNNCAVSRRTVVVTP